MPTPHWRISSVYGGVVALRWSNTRGYVQVGPVFLTVRDARAYIDAKGK